MYVISHLNQKINFKKRGLLQNFEVSLPQYQPAATRPLGLNELFIKW